MRKRFERDGLVYLTSSASLPESTCVAVAVGVERTGVLDSKDPMGATLEFRATTFHSFVAGLKQG
ncbi:hypothetical protein GCM10022243_65780 [Saccharothrix violaceirubra]|uniref:DUF397 domain-containing protein n=1 Tax=Saccharothrix violaceirubra TaxID=413306 RepID=A0A7W7T9G2_9PSEU|nr:DUF397 domain-containing protein [Saccharothrix violaceirubra]MBB4968935.1 hypothetical protein [Saccharothrix violaceirubra]